MTIWDERYKSGEGLRWWPNEELARFIGKTYKVRPFYDTVDGLYALDLGCGTGANSWLLEESGFTVNGIDQSADAIKHSNNFLSARWIEPGPTMFQLAELPMIPFEDARFDLVIDCQTIQHLSEDDHVKVYAEVARVLCPGGRFWSMHWSYGDHQAIYAGAYPELAPRNEDAIRALMNGKLTIESLEACVRTYQHRMKLAQWYLIEAVKP